MERCRDRGGDYIEGDNISIVWFFFNKGLEHESGFFIATPRITPQPVDSRERTPVTFESEAQWAPEPVGEIRRRDKFLPLSEFELKLVQLIA